MPNFLNTAQGPFKITYVAAAGADNVIKNKPGYLHAVVVGKDVNGGIIEVSNHASDGDGDVQVYLADPTPGTYLIQAEFSTGITVDMTTQTNCSFIFK